MGERSNFFVRIRAKEKTSDKFYKHQAFFGLYYQWCYGERMISRLRSAIAFVDSEISGSHGGYAINKDQMDRFKRYLSINFDMKDFVDTTDLIPYTVDDIIQGWDTAKSDIFDQAENHGFIYLDITLDDPDQKFGENKAIIKYAFVDNEYHSKKHPLPSVRNVENFADHDMGNDERKWYEPDPYWEDKPWGAAHKERFLNDIVPTAKKNMEEINASATLMTEDDRKEFVKFGRAYARKYFREAEKKKQEIKEKREYAISKLQYLRNALNGLPDETIYTVFMELIDKVYPKPQKIA